MDSDSDISDNLSDQVDVSNKRYLLRTKVAEIFDVHPQTITNWIDRGLLSGMDIYGRTFVDIRPKFEDQKVGLRLALIGSIRDEILNTDELAVELIRFLKTQYPGILTERYEVEETQKETELLCGIAENRKCITKGGELDYSKAAALLIDEFRSGKLGKVTLEWPKEQGKMAKKN